MNLVLVNLQSNQQIKLDNDCPFIIGRESVIGCTDKRVSRNHGRITCTTDGKLQVVALHTNPCFFTRNGLPPVIQINKNEEETLNEGDCLGLLPNAFWFKIVSNIKVTSSESKELKNENLDLSNAIIKKEVEDSCNEEKKFECFEKNSSTFISGVIPTPSTSTLETLNNEVVSAELENTKKLPLWMYKIDDPKDVIKSPSKRSLSVINESKYKKNKINPDIDDQNNSESTPSTSKILSISSLSQLTTESSKNEFSKQDEENDKCESDVKNEIQAPKRSICQYEGHCYRKNPQHKLDFSHPGDLDYIPYEERPLCSYGAACYRTNERHKVEFRHPPPNENPQKTARPQNTSLVPSPLPAKRNRKTIKRSDSDYKDEDEYDLEDPFINDSSSDEYLPSESYSEEEMDNSVQSD